MAEMNKRRIKPENYDQHELQLVVYKCNSSKLWASAYKSIKQQLEAASGFIEAFKSGLQKTCLLDDFFANKSSILEKSSPRKSSK